MWNYLWFIVLIKVTTSYKIMIPQTTDSTLGERSNRVHRARELRSLNGEGKAIQYNCPPNFVHHGFCLLQNRCLDWFPRLRAISLKVIHNIRGFITICNLLEHQVEETKSSFHQRYILGTKLQYQHF